MNDRLLQDQPRELWRWTASALAHGIRTRAISARDVTSACLQHIEEVNPTINAFVEVSEQETLASADQSDRAVAAGAMLGPLHGIPVSIKVNSDQRPARRRYHQRGCCIQGCLGQGRWTTCREPASRRRDILGPQQHARLFVSLVHSQRAAR